MRRRSGAAPTTGRPAPPRRLRTEPDSLWCTEGPTVLWLYVLGGLCLVVLGERLARLSSLTVHGLRTQLGGRGDDAVTGALLLGDADLVTGTAAVMRPVSFVVPVLAGGDFAQLARTVEGLLLKSAGCLSSESDS